MSLSLKPNNPPTNPSRTEGCCLRGETRAQGKRCVCPGWQRHGGGAETEPPTLTLCATGCLVRPQPATMSLVPLAAPEMPITTIPNPTQALRPSLAITSSLKPSQIGPDRNHESRCSHRIPPLELDGTQRGYPC